MLARAPRVLGASRGARQPAVPCDVADYPGDRTETARLRYFALDAGSVRVGFLAQSPTGQGCSATFDHISYQPGAPENLRDGS